MEILPHFWISYYRENLIIIKHKKIKNIIHLSKDESYVKKYDIEEIRVPIDYEEEHSFDEKNNILGNLHIFVDFIYSVLQLHFSHIQSLL